MSEQDGVMPAAIAQALDAAPHSSAQRVLDVLADLALGDRHPGRGICGHVESALVYEDSHSIASYNGTPLLDFWDQTSKVFFQTWPKFSGCTAFPVAEKGRDAAWYEFQRAADHGTMWEGDYGTLRWQLLGHLVREYSALVKSSTKG